MITVGYEANNILRHSGEAGDYGRTLVSRLARRHVSDFRALLFATRVKKSFRSLFTSDANVSTYLPTGLQRLVPEWWSARQLAPWMKWEKAKVFHALNDELPPNMSPEVKTVVTCHGPELHHRHSLPDAALWKRRMAYSLAVADAVVAPNAAVKQQLVEAGVTPEKVLVIGGGKPYDINDQMVEQYYQLYRKLAGAGA